ncbi:UDP-glycosyltransferase 83A1-like [Argentina anserina]|uniref:UDP-glycosyltransferase 83A1-like n=1 Tax=Argentina anserina TaxID=57926 RepID=UPI0021765F40|nr:UDP-glycosyltransferase 83A1-like [Potentilla anserina]
MSKQHILAFPYPAQGHVLPLMELSQSLTKHDFRVTFVHTECYHNQVIKSLAHENPTGYDQIHLVSIPDGLEPGEDMNSVRLLTEEIHEFMSQKLEELIENINQGEGGRISCLIADESCGWALEVARKMKIAKVVAFWPAAAASLVLKFCIPKLIPVEIIDNDGTVLQNQMVQLAQKMPIIKSTNFMWNCMGDTAAQKIIFKFMSRSNKNLKVVDRLICNSTYELEPAAVITLPRIVPIGPVLASSHLGNSAGSLWPQDSTCLQWLDGQPPCSVIYVAFGSLTLFDQTQFQELALALELSNRPFLWVVRPDIYESTHFPEGYEERVGPKGLMVKWAPQQKVLSHPSVACFLSHCGWNSTMEGVSNGVPFLCWLYFADQFLNESYICDIWKVGLRVDKNKSGIIMRGEIQNKVEQLLGDENYKATASKLKRMAMTNVKEGGQSDKNFKNFIKWVQS